MKTITYTCNECGKEIGNVAERGTYSVLHRNMNNWLEIHRFIEADNSFLHMCGEACLDKHIHKWLNPNLGEHHAQVRALNKEELEKLAQTIEDASPDAS